MTNNQLTSTHLAVKSELDGYKIHASRGQATAMAMVRLFESIDRDLEELQERRKTAIDSEPVGWTDEAELRDVEKDGCGYLFKANPITPHADPRRVIKLYRHAQQPVALDGLIKAVEFYEQIKRENPPVETDAWKDAVDLVLKEACRAAMLAAAPQLPGSEPATVPSKWIPVSERMPDCWCRTCRPVDLNDMRFVVCPDCGNKRCPRANDHRNACTGSNEPGQEGSAYPDTPREVK